MGKPVPVQHPAVVLRSQYRNMRSLVAVLLVALAALTTSVVILSIDGDGTSTTTSAATGAARLGDPFAARTQPIRPQGGLDESSVASAISQSGSRSYPTLTDSFQSQTEQSKPQGGVDESSVASAISQPQAVGGPDESKIAATLSAHSDTGPQARAKAWQEQLKSMTTQEREQAFGGR
jgi:hypothetical protein